MLFWATLISVLCCAFGVFIANKAGKTTYAIRNVVIIMAGVLSAAVAALLTGLATFLGGGVLSALLPLVGGAAGVFGCWARYRIWYR